MGGGGGGGNKVSATWGGGGAIFRYVLVKRKNGHFLFKLASVGIPTMHTRDTVRHFLLTCRRVAVFDYGFQLYA